MAVTICASVVPKISPLILESTKIPNKIRKPACELPKMIFSIAIPEYLPYLLHILLNTVCKEYAIR